MNALKLAAVLAIGFGTASLTAAAPPSCGACPSKAKRTVKVEAPDATLTASGLRLQLASFSDGACPTADCPATCTGPGSACCEAMGCCEKTACTGAVCDKTASSCALSEVEKSIVAALKRPISLHMEEVPLAKFFRHLANANGFNLCVDPSDLQRTGNEIDSPVTINVDGIQTSSALKLVLQPLGLTHVVEDDVCKIVAAKCEAEACDAPAPAAGPKATCDVVVPATAVAVCSATSESAPPAPKRMLACSGTACPITVCAAASDACAPTACAPTACENAVCETAACEGSVCGTAACGLRAVVAKQFTTIVTSAASELSECAAECARACGTTCRGAACDGGPCPNGVCEGTVCEGTVCATAACAAPVCETPVCEALALAPAGGEMSPCELRGACEPTDRCPGWVAAPSLAAPVAPYPIAYEPAGLYGVQRTAAVEPAPAGYATPAAYATPVEANPGLPVGRWTRTLNDQSVTIVVSPDGSFTATCTVPHAGCSLEVAGDCRATEDGLLFGVVTMAKVCPGSGREKDSVDPVACVEVEGFCRALIDQPFSARCRVKGQTMNVSNALFGGIGFVGTPGPGEPAHLALTMFSGAYEAE
ncbi:hypothetical protein [Alienimonas sp. DA493]|uniref:hypothetical protein n=1 Tax=Alienimonas sp. DA493 TaxID=3373605 RepID=UPI003754D481